MTKAIIHSRTILLYLFLAFLWLFQTAAIRVSDPQEQLVKERTERLASKRIAKKKNGGWRIFNFRLFKKKKAKPQTKQQKEWKAQIIIGVVLLVLGLIFSMIGLTQASYCASTLLWLQPEANCGEGNAAFGLIMLIIGLLLLIKGIINAGKEKRLAQSRE